jgi:large subunit ribosomal protein L17
MIEPYLTKEATMKVVSQLGPRFAKRQGGYTRIFFAGNRIADNAPVAVIEFVERGGPIVEPVKKTQKKVQALAAVKSSKKVVKKEKEA